MGSRSMPYAMRRRRPWMCSAFPWLSRSAFQHPNSAKRARHRSSSRASKPSPGGINPMIRTFSSALGLRSTRFSCRRRRSRATGRGRRRSHRLRRHQRAPGPRLRQAVRRTGLLDSAPCPALPAFGTASPVPLATAAARPRPAVWTRRGPQRSRSLTPFSPPTTTQACGQRPWTSSPPASIGSPVGVKSMLSTRRSPLCAAWTSRVCGSWCRVR
mmetsp:Transcript_41216/g.119361  ORF Transcript_41216/g.119361 Transcript_41216/m.119361 type:complete len:214 (-) Transcript_41216:311-952(-)